MSPAFAKFSGGGFYFVFFLFNFSNNTIRRKPS